MAEPILPTEVGEATAPQHADTPADQQSRLTLGDWLILVLVVAVQAIWVWRQTPDYWFVDDFWAMLGDGDLTLGNLVQNHGGHWTMYHRIAANVFYDTSGMSYWPVAGVFSAISWGAFALWSAWATNRLGASRFVSVGVGILVGMGIGVVFKPWLIGKVIGHVSWVTASMIISGPQRRGRRWLLLGTLLVGVSAGFQTVCFLMAATFYCVARRSLRYWLPSCFAALAVYLAWRRTYGSTSLGSEADLSIKSLAAFPFHMFDVAASAISRYLGISFSSAVIVTAVVGLWVLYRQFAGMATHHETLAGLTILVFTGATVYSRVLTGVSPASATRYMFPIILFLLLGFAPALKLRLPTDNTVLRAGVFVVLLLPLLWVLSTQRDTREAGFRFEDRRHTATQDDVSTMAFLLSEGIPFDGATRIRPRGQGGGTLTTRQLSGLIEDGLVLSPVSDNIAEMQAALTIVVVDESRPRSGVSPSQPTCGPLDTKSDISSEEIVIAGQAGRSVEIGWTDLAGGPGSQVFPLDADGRLVVRFVAVDQAKYWLDPLGGEYQWCR